MSSIIPQGWSWRKSQVPIEISATLTKQLHSKIISFYDQDFAKNPPRKEMNFTTFVYPDTVPAGNGHYGPVDSDWLAVVRINGNITGSGMVVPILCRQRHSKSERDRRSSCLCICLDSDLYLRFSMFRSVRRR